MSKALPRQLCVVGWGYVGLPLAVTFAKYLPTVGFEVGERRVAVG